MSSLIFILVILYIGIGFLGTKEIDKPFNRFRYEAVYEANLSRDSSLNDVEKINVWITVNRNLFSKKTITLSYFQYDEDNEFDYSDEGTNLILGEYVPVEFYNY
ncbi:MAG: hypothetical protein RBR71_14345 [Gudongella sp.]|nr:hypothetical protein [Gudongella sp.]